MPWVRSDELTDDSRRWRFGAVFRYGVTFGERLVKAQVGFRVTLTVNMLGTVLIGAIVL